MRVHVLNVREFESFIRRNPDQAVRLIVKAFKGRELLKVGNRSYLNAFRYPESRFDPRDLMPNGGSLRVLRNPDMLQPLSDPGKLFTDKYVIPPDQLVFPWAGRVYRKSWWGQVAGGLTEPTTVINNALGALTAGRTWKEKVFLRGDFTLARTGNPQVEVPSYTVLEVLGALRLADGINQPIIANSDPAGGNEKIDIIGGELDGNKANQTAGHGIYFENTSRFNIVRVFFRNIKEDGIVVTTPGECEDFYIGQCDFRNVDGRVIYLYGGMTHDGSIIGNHGEDVNGAIYLQDARTNSIMGNTMSNNGPSPTYGGVTLAGNSKLNSIVGNILDHCYYGVYCGGSSDNNMIGFNEITDIERHGVYVDGDEHIVKGNVVYDCSLASAGTYDGIHLACYRTIVNSNRCTDTRAVAEKTQAYGVRESAGDHNIIVQNIVLGNLTGGISRVGANTVAVNNIGYDQKEVKVLTNAGFTTSTAGSGAVSQTPFYTYVCTGTTASSSARAYKETFGLNPGDRTRHAIDYSKRLEWNFVLVRYNSDPEAIARIQLKQVSAEGDLADDGIGLRIDDLAVLGEAFGTARGTVSLGTLTHNRSWRVKIVLVPGVRVEFWINGALAGTLTGDYVPTGVTTTSWMVLSIINGTTGGVDARFFVNDIIILQEW